MRIPRALAAAAAATLFVMSIGVSAHADDTVPPEPVVTATTTAPAPSVVTTPPVVTPDPPAETSAPPVVTPPPPPPPPPVETTTPAAPVTSSAPAVVETTQPTATETTTAPTSPATETTTPESTDSPTSAAPSDPASSSAPPTTKVAKADIPTPEPTIEESTGAITSIDRVGCDVTITVTTTGPGFWTLDVYDDSNRIDQFYWITTGGVGEVHTTVWTITGPAGTATPGIGFYLALGPNGIDHVDPWFYPRHVGDACGAEQVPTELTLPGYTGSTTAGSTLNVHGTGYGPNEDVAVSFDDTLVGTFHTDEAGSFSGTFVVPSGADTGWHQVTGVGATSEKSACAKVKVVALTATIGEIGREGCMVSIPVTTNGPGSYTLTVWDDSVAIKSFTWTVTMPGVHTTVWTITQPIGTEAPGVAFIVTMGSKMLAVVDGYTAPDDVVKECTAAVPVTITLPDYTGSTTAGSTLQVTGSGYLPNEQVSLSFASTPTDVGTATADSTGTYSTTFVVPAAATVDIHHLTATGVTSGRAATAEVKVVQPPEVLDATLTLPAAVTEPAADTLANTGSDINPGFAALALTSVVAGAGVIAIGRRRQKTTE